MSVKIYFHSSLEGLAQQLADNVAHARRQYADPFIESRIMVPNANLKQWLQLQLATSNTVTAHATFPFLENGLWQLLNRCDSSTADRPVLLDRQRLESLVLLALRNGVTSTAPALQPFIDYLGDGADARRLWQLTTRLAALFGDYEYHRPEWHYKWLNGKPATVWTTASATAMEHAQSAVFNAVLGTNGLRQQLRDKTGTELLLLSEYSDRVCAALAQQRPQRLSVPPVHVFGMSRLSPKHVEILFRMGQFADIYLYQFVVCGEFFEDLPTRAEQRRRQRNAAIQQGAIADDDNDDDMSLENPLLQAWGHAGRETMALLSETEERFPAAHIENVWLNDIDHAPKSVLQHVQYRIHHRCRDGNRVPPDSSLQIVACPSMHREVEMVHNSIIHNMARDPSLKLTDIAVLVTDMTTYKPALEYIFDGNQRIPYNLIDSTASTDSILGQAVLQMLTLAAGNFTRQAIFSLFMNPCFQAGTGLEQSDAMQWLTWADQLGIYRDFGPLSQPFTWQHGLQRLRMGRIMTSPIDDHGDWQCFNGIVPYADMQSANVDSVSRISAIIELLHYRLSQFRDLFAPLGEWRRKIAGLMATFLAIPADREAEAVVRQSILASFDNAATIDPLHTNNSSWSLALIQEFVQTTLHGIPGRKGTYLSRGVSLASLRPMRPIPFRIVYILGMTEGDFPGHNRAPILDLRAHSHPRHGDVSLADANRYLFLETVLAAQEKVVVSYLATNLQKDEHRFPCSVVRQLINFLDTSVLDRPQPIVELPLRSTSRRYLEVTDSVHNDVIVDDRPDERASALIDAANELRANATALRLPDGWDANHYAEVVDNLVASRLPTLTIPTTPSTEPRNGRVTLRELATFLNNPIDAALQRHLHIYNEREDTRALAENEPFYSDFRVAWRFEVEALEQFISDGFVTGNSDTDTARFSNFHMWLKTRYHYLQHCSQMPIHAFGTLDRDGLIARIMERIHGGPTIAPGQSLYPLLLDYTNAGFEPMVNAVLGTATSRTPNGLTLPPLSLECRLSPVPVKLDVTGSLPLGIRCTTTNTLRASLTVTASRYQSSQRSRFEIEPFLFFVAACASGHLPTDARFTLNVVHRNGIATHDYLAWPQSTAIRWLTEIVTDFLRPDRFDLLPFTTIENSRKFPVKPWSLTRPPSIEQEQGFHKILTEVINEQGDDIWSNYSPSDAVRLAAVVPPIDAFTKLQRRLRPFMTAAIPDGPDAGPDASQK